MEKPITVKQLLKYCEKQVELGNGDNVIMISSDDEGNNYHYLWYEFMTIKDFERPEKFGNQIIRCDFEWADEEIASKEETIILG